MRPPRDDPDATLTVKILAGLLIFASVSAVIAVSLWLGCAALRYLSDAGVVTVYRTSDLALMRRGCEAEGGAFLKDANDRHVCVGGGLGR